MDKKGIPERVERLEAEMGLLKEGVDKQDRKPKKHPDFQARFIKET